MGNAPDPIGPARDAAPPGLNPTGRAWGKTRALFRGGDHNSDSPVRASDRPSDPPGSVSDLVDFRVACNP